MHKNIQVNFVNDSKSHILKNHLISKKKYKNHDLLNYYLIKFIAKPNLK